MVQSFLQLRELLRTLPQLADALTPARCALLCTLRETASAPLFSHLLQRLDGLLDEDACPSTSAFLNRTQECFALKGGVDALLDVSRQAFCRATEQVRGGEGSKSVEICGCSVTCKKRCAHLRRLFQGLLLSFGELKLLRLHTAPQVHELADDLRQRHSLPGLRVQYTTRRGFYFVVGPAAGKKRGGGGRGGGEQLDPGDEGNKESARASSAPPQVPRSFTVMQACGRSVHATCDELSALNSRLRDAGEDCLRLTEAQLEGASEDILETYLPALHRLVDGLALADMLSGMARRLEGTGLPYTRPVLTSSGPIALVEARHPVLESADRGRPFQSNDAWLSLDSSLLVVTGPNMSGKSTYLRTVALCVVMAQVGEG